MKLSIRNYRGVERADIEIAPIALVAARNGGGKTSIVQATQAALLRRAVVVPGGTIKGAAALVTRGADDGRVTVADGDATVSIAYPKCTVAEAGVAPRASEIAAGTMSVLDLKLDERTDVLSHYIVGKVTPTELAATMKDAGYSDEAAEKLWQRIRSDGWDAVHKGAAEHGTRLKGQWEAATGEKFGAKKADGWMPPGYDPALCECTHEDLQMAAASAEDAVMKAVKSGALSEAQVARLKEAADAAEHVDVDARREALAEAQKALAEAKAGRAALPPVDETAIPCPHCGKGVVVDQPYRGAPALKAAAVDPITPDAAKARRLAIAEADGAIERLIVDVNAATAALSTAERIFSDGEAAAALLEEIASAGDATAAVEDAKRARDEAVGALRLFEKRENAANIFTAWSRNEKLIEALAPNGLRKAALVRGLKALNDRLALLSEAAGWGAVRLDETLGAHLDAEPYWLLSESMQWRVRVTLQVALASIEQAPLVVIDRADILDARGRNGLFRLLLAAAVPALVAMTANKQGNVPDLGAQGVGRTYFVEGGIARECGAETEERAA